MALSVFSGRRSDDPFESILPFPSFVSFPEHPSFACDVAAIGNTQVDWRETNEAHIFKVNLPGLSKENVKVQVEEGNVLQISGECKKEETASTDRWHRVERVQGSFLRRFRLPDNAKMDRVKAFMENGVLTIVVSKEAPPEQKSESRPIDISG